MREVFGRKIYDTDTSYEVCSHLTGNPKDGTNLIETLYRSRGGRYFLYMSGGPNSKAARISGLSTVAGEKIVPLEDYEARVFAEKRLSPFELERVFKEKDPDAAATILLTVPASMRDRIKEEAHAAGCSVSAFIRGIIEERFSRSE